VARLRTLLLETVSDDDLQAVLRKLVEQARAGNLAAARLLIAHVIGRPAEAVDPDRLALEEWWLFQQYPGWAEVLGEQPDKVNPELACALAGSMQQRNWETLLAALARKQEEAEAKRE
jgi:hypothetical protein